MHDQKSRLSEVLPGKDIAKVDAAKLRGETGQLILPGVTAFGVEAVVRSEQEKEYEGRVLRVKSTESR